LLLVAVLAELTVISPGLFVLRLDALPGGALVIVVVDVAVPFAFLKVLGVVRVHAGLAVSCLSWAGCGHSTTKPKN
jgi:hypothetical protein